MENANVVESRMQTICLHSHYYRLSVERKKFLTHEILDKAIQIAAYWEGKGGICRPIRQEEDHNLLLWY